MAKEYYDYYKQNNYKTELKKYLWKKDRNSWILNPENLPPEIEIEGQRENLKGLEFFNILILYPCGFNSDGRTVYVCKCFCGNYFIASGKNIKRGNTKSCNCLHRSKIVQRNLESGKDIIGTKQGLLYIESIAGFQETRTPGHKELMVNCICDCGRKCVKQATYIRTGDTRSCGVCLNHSIGERIIQNFLEENKIDYRHEYSFSDLTTENGYPMRFDFCIMKNNQIDFLLEYDGNIHFKESIKESGWLTEEEYKIRVQRDEKKNNYCLTNNIKLVRINYKENLQERLEEIFDGI